jgi:hypothetical protein
MKIAIMQPYFMPYIGYFQLINAVDQFVIYDNIQYTKKGWINRNRILYNGKDTYITLPIKKDSDYLNVADRFLSDTWDAERQNILNRIEAYYRKAPFFDQVFPLIDKCLTYHDNNLFKFLLKNLNNVCDYLRITTPIIISSTIPIDHSLKSKNKVIAICKELQANTYINPRGGMELYSKDEFKEKGIDLRFCITDPIKYQQFDCEFVWWLSIIDVMMFNSVETIRGYLNEYKLV